MIDTNTFKPATDICSNSLEQQSINNAEISSPISTNKFDDTPELLSLGSKGFFLKKMQALGIPIPKFSCINSELLEDILKLPIHTEIIQLFFPELNLTTTTVSVTEIINYWLTYFGESSFQNTFLSQKIAEFITSEVFYKQIKNSLPIQNIRQLYQQLVANNPNKAIIVRSSSTKEDCLGDAAAGKYASKINDNNDIIITCLQVLASAFYQDKKPEPIGIILQEYVDCLLGGVVMSYSALADNTVTVEYAPGQPRGAVSGITGITPHCYKLKQDSNNQFVIEFISGNIETYYELVETENSFTEIQSAITQKTNQQLDKQQLFELFNYIKKLEAIFMCPVDIEFAIDKANGKVYILQVRPITKLNGEANFDLEQPDNILISGDVISEGVASGVIFYLDPKLNHQPDIPENSILCTDYMQEWLLNPSVLAKVVAFVAKDAGKNDHIAISLRQEQKPFLIVADNFNKIIDNLNKISTVVCGNFQHGSSGYLIAGDQQQLLTTKLKCSNNLPDVSTLVPARAKLSLTFDTVKDSFVWLSDANNKLLDFFTSDGLLHKCLSANNLIQLSMHPQRQEIYTRLVAEIDCFLEDIATFVAAFKKFVNFPKNGYLEKFLYFNFTIEDFYSQVFSRMNDLSNKFIEINKNIKLLLNKMSFNNLDDCHDIQYETLDEWKADSKKLIKILQKLNKPTKVDDIHTTHDIIYFIHKIFVTTFPAMTASSGEAEYVYNQNNLHILCFIDAKLNILDSNCIDALKFLSGYTCVYALSLEDRSIITITENTHFAVFDIFGNSKANQGLKINLRYTDYLHDPLITTIQGRYKRVWFLAQLLKAINTTMNSGKIYISYDNNFLSERKEPVYATCLKIDITDFEILEDLQQATAKLIVAFKFIEDINSTLNNVYIQTDNWDDKVLDNQVKNLTEANVYNEDFAKSLFALAYYEQRQENIVKHLPWLNQQYKDVITFGYEMRMANIDNIEGLNKLLNNITTDKTKQQQLLKCFAMISPENATPLIFENYPKMFNK